jgi:hypothetical protein
MQHRRRRRQSRLVAGVVSFSCIYLAAGEKEGRRIEAKDVTVSINFVYIYI